MKKSTLAVLFFSMSLISTSESKMELICRTWKLTALKSFKKDLKPINQANSESLTFMSDGTYDKLLYGQLKIKGAWGFTQDSSKLLFNITSMNGASMAATPLDPLYPTDSIIMLTPDTLIIARLAYYGEKKEYGHDDWYYTKQDK
jgi:hypothetical protein